MSCYSEEETETIRRRLHETIWPLLMIEDGECNWKKRGGKDVTTTGIVYRGHHDILGTIWKVECELDISVEEFRNMFFQLDPTEWVPHLSDYKIIDVSPDNSWEICYSRSAGVPCVDDRDFLNIRFRQILGDGSIYELTESITHPGYPKQPKVIRGSYLPSGCMIRPIVTDPRRCHIVYINNVDIKGLVPKKILKMVTTDFLIDFIKALIKKTKEEKMKIC